LAHSKVWAVSRDRFREVVNGSSSKKQILIKLGLRAAGGNFNTLTARLIKEGLLEDLSLRTREHIKNSLWNVRKRRTIPLEEILSENSNYDRKHLKSRLLNTGKLNYKCALCGMGPEWKGKPLTLQIDHINGIHNDNRIENLRILCPNCHSQTETYVGKAMFGKGNVSNCSLKGVCIKCGNPASKKSKSGLCKICYNFGRRKTVRPEKEQLRLFVENYGYTAAGRKYGVSDKLIRKWINK
jgi:5-methylcytosine-specific restriction endonuclease McrA